MFNLIFAKLFGLTYESKVPGFEGRCYATWVNRNRVMNRFDGGVTGFFKLCRGENHEEFHGIIGADGDVYTTQGVYGTFRTPLQKEIEA